MIGEARTHRRILCVKHHLILQIFTLEVTKLMKNVKNLKCLSISQVKGTEATEAAKSIVFPRLKQSVHDVWRLFFTGIC